MLRIGDWTLAPERNELVRGDVVRTLKPKAMDVLVHLVRAEGAPVSTAELLDACWPGRVVLDATVHNRIAEIRAALNDDAKKPTYIRTVPARGYTAMIESESEASGRVVNPRIAVLPFVNLSADPDQEYFSDGISEDILDELGRIRSLIVRARQSSFVFKGQSVDPREIAEQLDVSHLVSGSVRTQGERIRVTARLTDIAANTDVWSDRYERGMTDIFAVQDDITAAIVNALGLELSAVSRPAVDVDAYHARLLGRYHFHRYEWEAAIACYERAIEIDPTYALAYACLANTYASRAGNSSTPDVEALVEREREFVVKALEHDPQQPLARALNALRLPARQAIDEFDALLRCYPSNADLYFLYRYVLHRIGRSDLAVDLTDRMVALDPLSAIRLYCRAIDYVYLGRPDAARADCRKCELLGLPAASVLAMAALIERDVDMVRMQCARPLSDWRQVPLWRALHGACGAFLEDDPERVEILLAQLDDPLEQLPFFVHFVMALLKGETEEALDYYERALERGEPTALIAIQGAPVLRTMFPEFWSGDRYVAMLRKLKLDKDSLAELSIPPLPAWVTLDPSGLPALRSIHPTRCLG